MYNKLVIFDMGNTLLHFHKGIFSDDEKDLIGLTLLSSYLEKKNQIKISIPQLKIEFLDKWYDDFYLRKEKLIELNFNKYLKDVIELNGFNDSEVNYFECMETFYSQYIEDAVSSKGSLDVLKYLKGKDYTIKVISNCILQDEIYKDVFKKHNLDEFIDEYIFSYSRKIRKPNSLLFKEAIRDYRGDIKDIIMVGDSLEADINPAQTLGFKGVWLTNGKKNTTDIIPWATIDKFSEIYKLINKNDIVIYN